MAKKIENGQRIGQHFIEKQMEMASKHEKMFSFTSNQGNAKFKKHEIQILKIKNVNKNRKSVESINYSLIV